MTRHKGIIAYGTDEDRTKLAALALATSKSGSEVIIEMIRDRFSATFGDADAKLIVAMMERPGK